MGGLAHFLEEEGLPTTQISLIREHSDSIRPPRALWVPFELGRPLGVPNDAAFQTRVLLAALKLLESPKGPVLEDFPDDVPVTSDGSTAWACPVNFATAVANLSEVDQLRAALKGEMAQLYSWYNLATKKRGRTTVGVSGLDLEAIGDFISAFLDGDIPENPREDLPLGIVLKLATEDLKAYYWEAITAQPGQVSPSSEQLSDWFWDETTAGKVLLAVKQVCMNSQDDMLQVVGMKLLVPMAQALRKGIGAAKEKEESNK